MCPYRRSAPSMPPLIGTDWLITAGLGDTKPRGRHCRSRPSRTISGAPITTASSCSPMGATAIRSQSPTSRVATSSAVRRSVTLALNMPSRSSSDSSGNTAFPNRYARTTASLSLVAGHSSGLPRSRSGGYGSGSPSNGSSLAGHSKTGVTSACISRSRKKLLNLLERTSFSSRHASIPSSRSSTTSDLIRRSR